MTEFVKVTLNKKIDACPFCGTADSSALVVGPANVGKQWGSRMEAFVRCEICNANGPHFEISSEVLQCAADVAVDRWNVIQRQPSASQTTEPQPLAPRSLLSSRLAEAKALIAADIYADNPIDLGYLNGRIHELEWMLSA